MRHVAWGSPQREGQGNRRPLSDSLRRASLFRSQCMIIRLLYLICTPLPRALQPRLLLPSRSGTLREMRNEHATAQTSLPRCTPRSCPVSPTPRCTLPPVTQPQEQGQRSLFENDKVLQHGLVREVLVRAELGALLGADPHGRLVCLELGTSALCARVVGC